MSLLRVRRERVAEGFGGPRRPARLWKLVAALVGVVALFWYLDRIA